jgi:hypothetical protein
MIKLIKSGILIFIFSPLVSFGYMQQDTQNNATYNNQPTPSQNSMVQHRNNGSVDNSPNVQNNNVQQNNGYGNRPNNQQNMGMPPVQQGNNNQQNQRVEQYNKKSTDTYRNSGGLAANNSNINNQQNTRVQQSQQINSQQLKQPKGIDGNYDYSDSVNDFNSYD